MENYSFNGGYSLFLAMLSGGLLAFLLGATPEMVATVLPKSITMPIAMEVSRHLGGIPAVTAVGVVVAGLQGSIFGYLVLKNWVLNIKKLLGFLLVRFLTRSVQ